MAICPEILALKRIADTSTIATARHLAVAKTRILQLCGNWQATDNKFQLLPFDHHCSQAENGIFFYKKSDSRCFCRRGNLFYRSISRKRGTGAG